MESNDIEVEVNIDDIVQEETYTESSSITHNYNYSYTDAYEIEDIDNRNFFINSDIDDDCINSIGYHILRCNRLDKGIPIEDRTPIRLYINSCGGDIYAGYSLIDIIKTSKTPIYTINEGVCMSMAFLISIAGQKRYAFPHSVYLMHEGYSGGSNSMSKLRERIEFETGQMENKTRQYVLENTTISEDVYNAKYKSEWYMYSETAKEYGIVDSIIGADCSIDEIL